MTLRKTKETRKKNISIGFLLESNKSRLRLTALTGEIGLNKEIADKNIHRPGLALAGYVQLFRYDRVQVFGNTEMRYLEQLDQPQREKTLQTIFQFDIPCIVITSNNKVDDVFLRLATERQVAVLQSPFETTKFIYFLSDFLDDQFSPQTVVHGSFVDVYGVGVLLIGRSGIGKSEIALDLVERGHRLVADDVVMITRKGEGILMGSGTDLVKHFMEIRGLGLIDVRSMFGIRAIRFQKRVELVIELMEWRPDEDYTRTGLDNEGISILEVQLPRVELPIFPGKNVTVICEVISLNYLLKHYGYDAAKEFTKRLEAVITEKSKHIGERAIDYFEHDFE
ncbi:MAG: HPr kinase/phosphorylase [Ignavibacteriae bacterium]|nr:HPr kinase/phosphorylase [Ignavibacteria bacterium]MBI3364854.1 HPr kinase/phosphorylase [Ignavibacteriota bacterium]